MNYGINDIGDMRRDALRRTREMHRQNMSVPDIQPDSSQASASLFESQEKESVSDERNVKRDKKPGGGPGNILSGIFGGGRLDNDKIIIIALILILAKDGADLKLLIALAYIL